MSIKLLGVRIRAFCAPASGCPTARRAAALAGLGAYGPGPLSRFSVRAADQVTRGAPETPMAVAWLGVFGGMSWQQPGRGLQLRWLANPDYSRRLACGRGRRVA